MKTYFGSPRPAELLSRPLLNRDRARFCLLTQIDCFSDPGSVSQSVSPAYPHGNNRPSLVRFRVSVLRNVA